MDFSELTKYVERKFSEWLESETIVVMGDEELHITMLDRLTHLYIKNRGSLEITGFGEFTKGDKFNPYGNYGLNFTECMQLVSISSTIWAMANTINMANNEHWFEHNLWIKVRNIHERDMENKIASLQGGMDEIKNYGGIPNPDTKHIILNEPNEIKKDI